jgi:hypothetical protein
VAKEIHGYTVPDKKQVANFLGLKDDGSTACGAAFAHEPTARNGGAVLLQAMLMAWEGDMEAVLNLSHGVDYDEGHVHHYNGTTHRVEPNAIGTLYFTRLREGANVSDSDN